MQVLKDSLLIDFSVDDAVPFLPALLTATFKTGRAESDLIFEPKGIVTFIVDGKEYQAAPVRAKASVTVPLGAGTHAYALEYGGDANYAAVALGDGRMQDTVDYHVSVEQSTMTVTPAANGFSYNIVVQLNDSAGNPIKIGSLFAPLIRLSCSRGVHIDITSHGNGNYTAILPIQKAAAETLIVTATINGVPFKTVALAADTPRHRAAHS